jgi:hypothetical protein
VVTMSNANKYKLKQFSGGKFNLPEFIRSVLKPRHEKITLLKDNDGNEKRLELNKARPYVGMYAPQSAAATSLYRVGGRQYEIGLLYAFLQCN